MREQITRFGNMEHTDFTQDEPTKKQAEINFGAISMVVEYDPLFPDRYTVVFAYHNGNDVTEFYRATEKDKQRLYNMQIREKIAIEMHKGKQDPFAGCGDSYRQRA